MYLIIVLFCLLQYFYYFTLLVPSDFSLCKLEGEPVLQSDPEVSRLLWATAGSFKARHTI